MNPCCVIFLTLIIWRCITILSMMWCAEQERQRDLERYTHSVYNISLRTRWLEGLSRGYHIYFRNLHDREDICLLRKLWARAFGGVSSSLEFLHNQRMRHRARVQYCVGEFLCPTVYKAAGVIFSLNQLYNPNTSAHECGKARSLSVCGGSGTPVLLPRVP